VIAADLNELNNGRFGYGSLFTDNGSMRYVLYRPCGYIAACPWGATCSTTDLTSVWVCEANLGASPGAVELTTCDAYGVIPDFPNFTAVDPDDSFQGFTYKLQSQADRTTTVTLTCKSDYPSGHILIDAASTRLSEDGELLDLAGSARAFCPRNIPTPVPNASQCRVNVTQGTYTLNLDLTKYAVSNTSVTRSRPYLTPYDLIYRPCGGVACPVGFDCGGEEEARVFLCEKPGGGSQLCTAYGLDSFGCNISVTEGYIPEGVEVLYQAYDDKEARVIWECDPNQAANSYTVQPTVTLSGDNLTVQVISKDACIQGSGSTPTPPRHIIPPKPTPPAGPSPTPLVSPNAVYAYWNATHYMALSLIEIQEPWPWHQWQDLYIRGEYGEIYTVWNPWDRVPCPNGWPCNDPNESANLWQCWDDEDYNPYCHAVADKTVPGFTYGPTTTNWDLGSTVLYPGQWNARMNLRISCPPFHPQYDRTLYLGESIVAYATSMSGPTWTFNATSGVACPRPFTVSPAPTASRSPPPPNPTVQTTFNATVNDQHWYLDLRDMHSATQGIIIARDRAAWYRSEFYYSPLVPQSCPEGKDCGVYAKDKANVWECGDQGQGTCFPVGDRAYGLTIRLINESLDTSGLNVSYQGGAGNHSVQFFYHCEPDLGPGEIELGLVGDDTVNATGVGPRSLIIHVQTVEACGKAPGPEPEPLPLVVALSPGAVSLVVFAGLLLLYFGLGTLVVYALHGTLSVPNKDFWLEVYDSIAAALNFIISCGRRRPVRVKYSTL
jgi:hypothetical protein